MVELAGGGSVINGASPSIFFVISKKKENVVELVGGGSVINGAYRVQPHCPSYENLDINIDI